MSAKTTKRAKPKPSEAAKRRAKRFLDVKEALGWTEREWASKADVSHSHITNVINGVIEQPQIGFYIKTARASGATIGFLADGQQPMWSADLHPDTTDPYPTRAPMVAAARLLPVPYRDAVVDGLLVDSDHEVDPGAGYWSAQFSALIQKFARGD
jgi:transcriptional regulator with XRE-family HTH domain